MKHDVVGKLSIKETLMDRNSVSFYCIDFLIDIAVVSDSLAIKNLSPRDSCVNPLSFLRSPLTLELNNHVTFFTLSLYIFLGIRQEF